MACGSIPTMILISTLTKYINDFFLCLATFILTIVCLLLMGLLPMIKYNVKGTEVMIYCIVTIYLSSVSSFHIISRAMLAKFVPENIQSITEGFRNALFELAAILSGLSVMLPVNYLPQTMIVMVIMICVSLAWYITEEQAYRNIKVIDVNFGNIATIYINETTI